MVRRYLFADEAGNFDFTRKGSRYFILTSIALDDCAVGDGLLTLRRDMAWRGMPLKPELHASEETQAIRDEVFGLIARHDFRIDATIFDKPKVSPASRATEEDFYEEAWYVHMRHVAKAIAATTDELLVVGASLGERKKQQLFRRAIDGACAKTSHSATTRTAFWSTASDPCLQVADYCCWAIQRRWERGDPRSYVLISNKIASEFDVLASSATQYY